MKKIIFLLLLLLCINLVSAKTYEITLLTIGEVGEDIIGGTANAFLEVKPGTGRIFLDSFPLTKLDTQISTRYANKIACDYLDMDCSRYDFFYTIRAGSTIVGGPSASASLTILTIAALKDVELRNDTVMTGTINSGGSIGPVGGVLKKALAAEKKGFKRVLIPLFTINLDEVNMTQNKSVNDSDNITEIKSIDEANLSIEVIKVRNIDEALGYFTDIQTRDENGEIIVPDDYTSTMKEISNNLCRRATDLYKNTYLVEEADINKSEQFLININKSFENQDYYSVASYCFSLCLILRKANLEELQEKNPLIIEKIKAVTRRAINEFDKNLEELNMTTLSELETYVIVKERLVEAEESLTKSSINSTENLAYAVERYYSAIYWSEFFRLKGELFELDKEYLKEVCYKKISEAEERINYASLYLPLILQSSEETIKQAYAFALKENYKMCLFKASYAKAESNLLLSSIAVSKDQIDELAEEKLKAVKKVIVKEQKRNVFPILGYSYYQYANTLREDGDVFSSLIFGEYALELSNIEIYFPKKGFKLPRINYSFILWYASAIILGLAIGIIIGAKIIRKEKKKVSKRRRKKRKK